jgi:hypothetical protein
MTAPTFDGTFAHRWTAEILPNRPMILPSRHFIYPAAVEEVERGALEVLIQPMLVHRDGGAAFLATCALGFRDPAAPTGIWAMPDPDWLCAISGGYAYLIDVAAPERFVHLRYRPVLEVLPAPLGDGHRDLILFAGHTSVLAWGRDGEAWESPRLSWEGLTHLRVDGDVLRGEGWDMRTDKDLPFALDLATGRKIEAS